MYKTLEDILKEYKFAPKSKKLFRKKAIWVDDLPEFTTVAGAKAYRNLISLLYDISNLTGCNVNPLVDSLDTIVTTNY